MGDRLLLCGIQPRTSATMIGRTLGVLSITIIICASSVAQPPPPPPLGPEISPGLGYSRHGVWIAAPPRFAP